MMRNFSSGLRGISLALICAGLSGLAIGVDPPSVERPASRGSHCHC